MACRPLHGTIYHQPVPIHRQPVGHLRSKSPNGSHARAAVDALAATPPDDLARAVEVGPLCWTFGVPFLPTQRSGFEVVLQPVESAQYLAIRYTECFAKAGIEPSVGSCGDFYDNAFAETVIGLFKTKVIRGRGLWRNAEAVKFATLE